MELKELEEWFDHVAKNREDRNRAFDELILTGESYVLIRPDADDKVIVLGRNSELHKFAAKYLKEETDVETQLLFKKLIDSLDETTISDKR